jgi:hypothetical protein
VKLREYSWGTPIGPADLLARIVHARRVRVYGLRPLFWAFQKDDSNLDWKTAGDNFDITVLALVWTNLLSWRLGDCNRGNIDANSLSRAKLAELKRALWRALGLD